MPCNCGGGAPQTVVGYQLNLPDGTFRQYVTYQEAEAANQLSPPPRQMKRRLGPCPTW
ncbi:DUF7196 family protein [Streptomyces decoyicus]